MRCTNKRLLASLLLLAVLFLSGCGGSDYALKYDPDTNITAFTFDSANNEAGCESFASSLCVTDSDIISADAASIAAEAGGLFCAYDNETLYSKNANAKMNPASLTKVMTALLALEYGNLEDTLTASSNVIINENGAQVMHLNEGDRLTLDQALHALLLSSANDCGVLIAEYVAGSVEAFASLMNKKALSLGATNTHFVNPHGLNNEDHYTTAYDLYLIFNEAIRYEKFCQLINESEYTFSYKDRDGNPKEYTCNSTNGYISGDFEVPQGITVVGGKTGTTSAAGSCLIILSKDSKNKAYISVLLHDTDRDITYKDMSVLLNMAQNHTR